MNIYKIAKFSNFKNRNVNESATASINKLRKTNAYTLHHYNSSVFPPALALSPEFYLQDRNLYPFVSYTKLSVLGLSDTFACSVDDCNWSWTA